MARTKALLRLSAKDNVMTQLHRVAAEVTGDVPTVEIARVFTAQRRARGRVKRSGPEERRQRLQRLRAVILAHADEIDAALHADLAKPRMGADHFEIRAVLGDIDEALRDLDVWMTAREIEPSPHFAGDRAFVTYEPRGVVLLFGAWNFPFGLTFQPLVPIVAAGNVAIVKPNELQPRTSGVIATIIRETFAEDEVAVFEGGVPLAEALLELPFDHIFFTGSPQVGKRIMAAAAKHLASVTLELGGKCPAVLDDHYAIDVAAQKIVGARFFNGGQICLAVDYVLVPKTRERALVHALNAAIDAFFFVDGGFQIDRVSRIVDARNFDRLANFFEDAVKKGAVVERQGAWNRDALRIEPAILTSVPAEALVRREEIFGPILPIVSYDDPRDIEDIVDATGKPLAVYIFSDDRGFVTDMLMQTSSGGVTINGTMTHASETRLPFGGVNGSGMGRYRGHAGFLELSNARSVFEHTPRDGEKLRDEA